MTADRKITIIRHEYRVPLRHEWGATHADVSKALVRAARDYRQVYGVAEGVALSDDALRFTGDDEYLIVYFTEAKETS